MTSFTGSTEAGLPYQEISDGAYSSGFAASCTVSSRQTGVLLAGPCPRCAHFMQTYQAEASQKSIVVRAATEEILLMCTCQESHPGRPDGWGGCGAYWTIRLTRASL
jgi:hypothetical protein